MGRCVWMIVMISTRRLPVWIWVETWKDDAVVVATRCGRGGKPRTSAPRFARAERHVHADSRDSVGEDRWRAGNLVFNSGDGAPLHRNTIVKQFHVHVRCAGIERLRPHDLRHTYGSLLMSRGVPLKTISELMGHASIEITADIYLHSLDVQVRDTARSVENALSSREGRAEKVCPACGRPLPRNSEAIDIASLTARIDLDMESRRPIACGTAL